MCDFMENCSGHGNCDLLTGKCLCEQDWLGPDCSTQAHDTKNFKARDIQNTHWFYFRKESEPSFDIEVLAENALVDIYIKFGQDELPNT